MARSRLRPDFALSDFDVITGPPSLPSRLPSPAGGPLPSEAIDGKPVLDALARSAPADQARQSNGIDRKS
jgi:hypothetical protein